MIWVLGLIVNVLCFFLVWQIALGWKVGLGSSTHEELYALFEGAKNLTQAVAIGVGGVVAYIKLVKGRLLTPHLAFTLSPFTLTYADGSGHKCLRIRLVNVGNVNIRLHRCALATAPMLPGYDTPFWENVPRYVRYVGEALDNLPQYMEPFETNREWLAPTEQLSVDVVLASEGREPMAAVLRVWDRPSHMWELRQILGFGLTSSGDEVR
jgi:hypothetical protein